MVLIKKVSNKGVFYLEVLSKETDLKTTFELNTMIFCQDVRSRRSDYTRHEKRTKFLVLFCLGLRKEMTWCDRLSRRD